MALNRAVNVLALEVMGPEILVLHAVPKDE
jgi:hypothetical protein